MSTWLYIIVMELWKSRQTILDTEDNNCQINMLFCSTSSEKDVSDDSINLQIAVTTLIDLAVIG